MPDVLDADLVDRQVAQVRRVLHVGNDFLIGTDFAFEFHGRVSLPLAGANNPIVEWRSQV
jgi:hypothetical protein